MASYNVTPDFIAKLTENLETIVKSLPALGDRVKKHCPNGIPLKQGPEISEALGRLTDFSAMVEARIQRAQVDKAFGISRKTHRTIARSSKGKKP